MRPALIATVLVLLAAVFLGGPGLVVAPIAACVVPIVLLKQACQRKTGRRLDAGQQGLLVAAGANLFMIAVTLASLLPTPSAAAIRPMGLAAIYFLAAAQWRGPPTAGLTINARLSEQRTNTHQADMSRACVRADGRLYVLHYKAASLPENGRLASDVYLYERRGMVARGQAHATAASERRLRACAKLAPTVI